MKTRLALATAVVLTLTSLTAWIPGTAASAALPLGAFGAGIAPPVHHGTLPSRAASGTGATVTATGLRWHAPRLPRGMSLLVRGRLLLAEPATRPGRTAGPGRTARRAVRRAPLRRR